MEDNNIVITDTTIDDIDYLYDILSKTWLETYVNIDLDITKEDIEAKINSIREGGKEKLKKRLSEDKSFNSWIAKDKESVIGFISVEKCNSENKILSIYVLPKHQKKGLGKKLMQTALTWLGSTQKISLEVASYNRNAIIFYKSFGFEEKGETSSATAILPNGKVIPEILMIRENNTH